jgi:general secretion pathway protein N
MTLLGELTPARKVLLGIAATGLAAAMLAFVPSPLALFDLFEEPPAPEVKAPPPLRLDAAPPLASFDVIAARPLFNVDRKPDPLPPPPETAKPAIALGDLTQYRVVGTVRDNAKQLGLVQKSGGALMTLKPGDTFEGWTVERIDRSGIAISGGGRKEVLAIPKATNAAKSP